MLRSVIVLVCTAACGFVADPQIDTIEIQDSTQGNGTEIRKYEVKYGSGGKLEKVILTVAGEEVYTVNYEYKGDLIDTTTRVIPDGTTVETITFDYKDSKLQQVNRDPGNGGTIVITTISYKDDRIADIKEDNGTSTVTYAYDGENRIEKVTSQDTGGDASIDTYSYKDDDGFGELKSIKTESGRDTSTISFSYDEARRLERVNQTGFSQSVKYSDDGLAEEILGRPQGSQNGVKTLFTYTGDNGNEGMDVRLQVTAGEIFTLDGRRLDQPDLLGGIIFGG